MELHSVEGIVLGLEGREEILAVGSSCVGLHVPELAEGRAVEEVVLGDGKVVVEVDYPIA